MAQNKFAKFEHHLNEKNIQVVIETLKNINEELSPYLTSKIIELAYHHNHEIREHAYYALFYVRNYDLKKVIQDGVVDNNKKVSLAARKLFHRDLCEAAKLVA